MRKLINHFLINNFIVYFKVTTECKYLNISFVFWVLFGGYELMRNLTRRDFIKTAAVGAGAAALLGSNFSKVLIAGAETPFGEDISEVFTGEDEYEGWGQGFHDINGRSNYRIEEALESITNSIRHPSDSPTRNVATDVRSPFITSQYGNFRRNNDIASLIAKCERYGTQAIDSTVKDWMEGNNGYQKNGENNNFAFKVLCFLEDSLRAFLQSGYNSSDPFGMEGENILSLIDAFNIRYKDGSRIIDSLTWVKAASKADESIDVMDYPAFVYTEAHKLYAGKGVKPNEINSAYKSNELVRIPKRALLRLVEVHFNGELDGVKLKELETLLTYCPRESPINPDAGNCYIEISKTPNVVVVPVAKVNGVPQNIWVPDQSIDYILPTTQTNLSP